MVGAKAELARGALNAEELLESCLLRIDETEPLLHAWAHLDPAVPRAQLASLEEGPLHGIPVGVKDIFNTRDMPTGMGSPVWSDFTPGNDARVVFSTREAGCVVVGKTVTAEFAVHAPGPTRNPRHLGRAPGTSSSGSAVSVAAGNVPWALGSQTAGSIVRPAAYCGVYAYKPSYGLVPRTGMLKTTDTLDQIGFFHRDPADARVLLDAIRLRGSDHPLVYKHLDTAPPAAAAQWRVGLITDSLHTWANTSPAARDVLVKLAASLGEHGHAVEDVALPPEFHDSHEIHRTIYDRCIAYYFAEESEQAHLVSGEITGMVERGRSIGLTTYTAALERQEQLRRSFGEIAKGYDVLLAPAVAGLAPELDEPEIDDSALIWSLVGAPVAVLPFFTEGSPLALSVQLVAARYRDLRLLDVLEGLAESGVVRPCPIADPRSAIKVGLTSRTTTT